jgi:hypothetical protein
VKLYFAETTASPKTRAVAIAFRRPDRRLIGG